MQMQDYNNDENILEKFGRILNEEVKPDSGTFKFGVSITTSYFPHDNSSYFNGHKESILDWMRQYSSENTGTL